jgi:hypothetical protein
LAPKKSTKLPRRGNRTPQRSRVFFGCTEPTHGHAKFFVSSLTKIFAEKNKPDKEREREEERERYRERERDEREEEVAS